MENSDLNMWCENVDDDLFCAIKNGVDYEIHAINDGSKSDPDITIYLVNIITEDGTEVEVEEYPKDFEEWLWDYFYEIPSLDPKELGWETNRFKETL